MLPVTRLRQRRPRLRLRLRLRRPRRERLERLWRARTCPSFLLSPLLCLRSASIPRRHPKRQPIPIPLLHPKCPLPSTPTRSRRLWRRRSSWQVVPNVGASALKVDLAVVDPNDPNRYCAGILLDGASYRAARTTRDRDVLRDEMLEALGWKLTHVWALDCYNNFDREVKRVTAFLKDATS